MNHPLGSEQAMLDAVFAYIREQYPEMADDGEMFNFMLKLKKDEEGDVVNMGYTICDSEEGILHEEGYF